MARANGSWNGLAFGPGTSYHLHELIGVYSLPDARPSNAPKALADGLFPGTTRKGGKPIVLSLHLIADNAVAFEALIDPLVAATDDMDTIRPLYFFDSAKWIFCRPVWRDIPITFEEIQRTSTARIEFEAADPKVYSGNPPTAPTGLVAVAA